MKGEKSLMVMALIFTLAFSFAGPRSAYAMSTDDMEAAIAPVDAPDMNMSMPDPAEVAPPADTGEVAEAPADADIAPIDPAATAPILDPMDVDMGNYGDGTDSKCTKAGESCIADEKCKNAGCSSCQFPKGAKTGKCV